MNYSLISTGKKFRPFLLYSLGKHFNINDNTLFHIGACIEMIHTYTLIHDDLPSMDNDDERRGKPSNHKVFGEDIAILTGDALQAESFYWLSSPKLEIAPSIKLEILNLTADFCGASNLISGQVLDINFQTSTAEENLKGINLINNLKTAKFIALPLIIASKLAGQDKHFEAMISQYGETLGAIFQILDDFKDKNDNSISIVNILGEEQSRNIIQELKKNIKDTSNKLAINYLKDISSFLLRDF